MHHKYKGYAIQKNLTNDQLELFKTIMRLRTDGLTQKEIGTQLGVSAPTISRFITHCMDRLNIRNEGSHYEEWLAIQNNVVSTKKP
jgi:DNA-binding NarL/FixJ family response regulator